MKVAILIGFLFSIESDYVESINGIEKRKSNKGKRALEYDFLLFIVKNVFICRYKYQCDRRHFDKRRVNFLVLSHFLTILID